MTGINALVLTIFAVMVVCIFSVVARERIASRPETGDYVDCKQEGSKPRCELVRQK